jgi:hypothetical protein
MLPIIRTLRVVALAIAIVLATMTLGKRRQRTSLYVLHVSHKSGSMWSHRSFGQLCGLTGRHLFSTNGWHCCPERLASCCPFGFVNATLIDAIYAKPISGVPVSSQKATLETLADVERYLDEEDKPYTFPLDTNHFISDQDVCMGPFREFRPIATDKRLVPIIVLRNPLDVVVSAYYSFVWTHAANPELEAARPVWRNLSIDEFALSFGPRMKLKTEYIHQLVKTYPGHVTSYAELALSYRTWVRKVAVLMDIRDADMVAGMLDVKNQPSIPKPPVGTENIQHIRAIVPGNYRLHLQPDTIQRLERLFADQIELLKQVEHGLQLENLYGLPEKAHWT